VCVLVSFLFCAYFFPEYFIRILKMMGEEEDQDKEGGGGGKEEENEENETSNKNDDDNDDRSSKEYHEKWSKFTEEEMQKIQLEEAELKQEMEKLSVANELEKKTKKAQEEKKQMLREAKERWEHSEEKEMSRRVTIEKETEVTRAIRAEELEQNSKSLHFREVAKCSYEIKKCAKPIKIFIESAKDTTISCAGTVKTSTMEIWNCSNCEITFESGAASTKTTQIDECENVTLLFPSRDTIGSIYHATTSGLSLVFTDESMLDGKNIHVVDVDDNDFRELQKKEENEENNDGSSSNSRVRQHVTRFVNGKILTERVIRGKDEFPTTARELNANSVEEAEAKAKEERRAANKAKGNEAFKAGDYGSAIAHYELSLQDTELDSDKSIVHSNRAACFLKLGRLEEALKEAERSVSLDEKNVKGNFRVGLALHALKRYGEAVKALEKAQSLEKKKQNKDIENAIRMAEFMGRKQAAETSA